MDEKKDFNRIMNKDIDSIIELISAKEAKRLSEENQKESLNKVLGMIKYSIRDGRTSCSCRIGMSVKQINELMDLGYSIRKHIDEMMGEEIFVISW